MRGGGLWGSQLLSHENRRLRRRPLAHQRPLCQHVGLPAVADHLLVTDASEANGHLVRLHGHLWPDSDDSTRTAIAAVIEAREGSLTDMNPRWLPSPRG